MNRKWYEENKKNLKVEYISVYRIDPGIVNNKNYSVSQMRTGGANSAHVADLKAKILADKQDIPVSLEPILGKKGQYDYSLLDGNHRFSAIKEINDELLAEGKSELLIKVVVHVGLTARRKKELQIIWNNHEPALASTFDDEVDSFLDLVKEHNVCAKELEDDELSDNSKIDAIKDYINSIGCVHKQPRTVAKKVFEKLPNPKRKIRTYTPVQAYRQWNRLHGLVDSSTSEKLEWPGSGIQAGISVYFVDAEGHTGRAHGQQLEALANPTNKGVISKKVMVAWMKSATGKSPDDVVKFREKVEKLVKRVNHERRNDGARSLLWDEVWFLPQIISSSKYEEEVALIQGSTFNKANIKKVVDNTV